MPPRWSRPGFSQALTIYTFGAGSDRQSSPDNLDNLRNGIRSGGKSADRRAVARKERAAMASRQNLTVRTMGERRTAHFLSVLWSVVRLWLDSRPTVAPP